MSDTAAPEWRPVLLRCPWCGACVLPDDAEAHGDAHRAHDDEHERQAAIRHA
ncbi:MAG TPA: hypothetical protein VGR98_21105 [Streptosporangiaceae bacterium]|nr:hypothetical protein [Streptosporangiaceae bacterium]